MLQPTIAPQFTTRYVDGELRFDLPVRPLGAARWIGLVPIAFGIVFVWGPALSIADAVQHFLRDGADGVRIGIALFELIFVVAGVAPIALGAWCIAGRCQIGWSPERLRASEILGPLRWTRRMPREAVRRLAVSAASSYSSSAARPRPLEGFAALMVEFVSGTRKLLAIGYPKPMLLQVAEQLTGYIGGGKVEVLTPTAIDESDGELLVQPAESRIAVEEQGDETHFLVPPAGVVRGSSGLFMFGILWCLFMTVITAGFLYSALGGRDDLEWYVWLIMICFWAVGVGLLLAAFNMGRRVAVLSVTRQILTIETRSLFGRKQQQWAPGEVVAVRADASGIEVNDEAVLELQIHPASGKKVGFLAGRDTDELKWIAGRLRKCLGVGRFMPRAEGTNGSG